MQDDSQISMEELTALAIAELVQSRNKKKSLQPVPNSRDPQIPPLFQRSYVNS
jgi:hypothetical protein